MKFGLPMVLVVVMVSAGGYVHGLLIDRWGTPQFDGPPLSSVPLEFGDWKGEDLEELRADVRNMAGIHEYLHRRYRNAASGQEFVILFVRGRPRNIGVHTPDVCFKGAGYQQLGDARSLQFENEYQQKIGDFTYCDFQRQIEGLGAYTRTFWSWTTDGEWVAPGGDVRAHFRKKPYLYKLYILRPMATPEEKIENDAAHDFFRELSRELAKTLFEKSAADAVPDLGSAEPKSGKPAAEAQAPASPGEDAGSAAKAE